MSSNINSETGEYNNAEGRSPRFSLWVFLMMCSVITLKSSAEVKNDMEEANTAARWAVACSAITFTVSSVIVLTHLIPIASQVIVGSMIEGIVTLVLVGFWIATVSIVSNTHNALGAVKSDTNQVANGNLYYFSWAGFVLSIMLIVSYLRSAYGLDLVDEMKGRSNRLMHWAGLLASSMVVMGSSARVLNEDCNNANEAENFSDAYCTRTKFAISLGTIGVVFSIAVVGMKLKSAATPVTVELFLSGLLAVMNIFGVAYITSNSGPGRAIGNLYYFTWSSMLLSAAIVVEGFNSSNQEQVSPQESMTATSDDGNINKQSEVSVESMDPERGYD